MEKNGLNLNTEVGSLLSLANLAYNAAEKRSQDRIKYSKFLIEYSNEIDKAIKNNDIKLIFALEKDAQEYDYIMAKPEDKRRDSLSALQMLYDYIGNVAKIKILLFNNLKRLIVASDGQLNPLMTLL